MGAVLAEETGTLVLHSQLTSSLIVDAVLR